MVYRFSWLAGIAAVGLAFWELSYLLRDSEVGTPWQAAILVSILLGAGITWTAIAYRAHPVVILVVNTVAFILTAGLLVAPDTLWAVFPTRLTWDAMWFEMGRALDVIRHGVEPVFPLPGIVLLLSALFWTLGFLLVAGLLNGRPFVAILTPLIVSLQFVIIDRKPKTLPHLAVFLGVVAISLLAIRADERDAGAGRLHRVNATHRPTKRPSPAITVLVASTIVLSLVAVRFVGDRVPNQGVVTWRSPAGFADAYSGSTSYNPFTDIQARVISQTDNPLFMARIEGADPSTVRFRWLTLDVYKNGKWQTDRIGIYPLEEEPWLLPGQEYRGETRTVTTAIRIDNLVSAWLPTPVTPNAAFSEDRSDNASMRVRRLDGSLYMPGNITYEGMQYIVQAEVPVADGPTIAALALTAEGRLSPLFATAEQNGESIDLDFQRLPEELELPEEEFWLQLPEDEFGAAFDRLATSVVGNVDTNFEKALALENWFRDSGDFHYNDRVPAEFTTTDVYEWLTDDTNEYARNGYCEQFATAMALLARAVDVPSRVVLGFTPGTVFNDDLVQVRDRNAHAWVELWIPSYGWMAFDPTPRRLYSAPTANDELTQALGFSPAAYLEDVPLGEILDLDEGGIPRIPGQDTTNTTFFVPQPRGPETAAVPFSIPDWVIWALAGVVAILFVLGLSPLATWIRRKRRIRRLASGDVSAAWEDIVERLVDLREPVNATDTPIEAASAIDEAFIPLANTYGASLYGEREPTAAVVVEATDAHTRATQHLTTRYSRLERVRAAYRPSRLIRRWRSLASRLSNRK